MESEEILRPTKERLTHSDHLADDGAPTKEQPYVRPQRIGTPWDRYTRPDKSGRTILEKHQIDAGNEWAEDYVKARYGVIQTGKLEPSVDGSVTQAPLCVELARRRLARADRLLRDYEEPLLRLVIFDGMAADEWAKRTNRHRKAGIWYLRDTLDVLAKHYGYVK